MTFMAHELLKESTRTGMKMSQVVVPIPSGYSITQEWKPSFGRGWIFTGAMGGGHQADGSAIPGYDFGVKKGLTWKGAYINREPLETRVDRLYYLTTDYLYKHIPYGPRPITIRLEVELTNTLDQDVFFSMTALGFELPIEKILEIFAPREVVKEVVRGVIRE